MIANYHTYTWRCMHATGTERQYIESAIEGGLKILGFSDHTPMPYSDGYISNVKMRVDQLEDYVTAILSLKNEYKNDIEIHLGLEVEYYPKYFRKLLEIISEYPIEYFLLGQHFLGNEVDDYYCGEKTTDSMKLQRYYEQCIEAIDTDCFTYFAHPDLLNYVGDKKIYHEWMRKLCSYCKEKQIPLEINFLGIEDKRHYPNEAFWKIAGEVGNQVVFGADAHKPEKVWNPKALLIAEKMVEKYNLEVIDTVVFKRPRIDS